MSDPTNPPAPVSIALTGVLTPAIRQKLYIGVAIVGPALGATQVGFLAGGSSQPTWLTVALAVYGFLCTALGITAASNVTPSDKLAVLDARAVARRDDTDPIG